MYYPVAQFIQKCILAYLVETRTIDRNHMIMLGPAVFHKRKWKMQEVVIAIAIKIVLFSVRMEGLHSCCIAF
jgi:hypothetical protein